MRASLPRGGRRPTPGNLVVQELLSSTSLYYKICWVHTPLGSENSHFFTWLFTKMAFSVDGGWESGLEPTGMPLVLKNAWICFRTSSSSLGNSPSLQNHSFCENQEKCNQTCEPTSRVFCSALMRQDLLVADSIFIPWNEAYYHSLSLSSLLLSMPCRDGSPMGDTFSPKFSLNNDSARNCCVYFISFCLHAD